jgi:hypothetical protein
MTATNTQPLTALGLDVGTSRIVAAQRQDKDIQFDTQLNAFVTIPFSKLTQGVLKKERIPHLVQDSEITVYGDESERFANLFHKETRRPMLRGIMNPDETGSLMLVRQIAALVMGEGDGQGRRVCFSVPAAPLGSADEVNEHEASLKSMLSKMGYDPHPISEGLAVVYGEMESSNYTGIGISCGGGLCNVCLAYQLQYSQGGRFYRCHRGPIARRTGHAHPDHQGRIVPLQRPFRKQDPSGSQHILRGHDPGPGGRAERSIRERAKHAQAQPSDSAGAKRRQCDAAWLPRPVREMPARNRTPGGHRRGSHGIQSDGFYRARGAGGRVERVVEQPRNPSPVTLR